jgi:hypothetical protein
MLRLNLDARQVSQDRLQTPNNMEYIDPIMMWASSNSDVKRHEDLDKNSVVIYIFRPFARFRPAVSKSPTGLG